MILEIENKNYGSHDEELNKKEKQKREAEKIKEKLDKSIVESSKNQSS